MFKSIIAVAFISLINISLHAGNFSIIAGKPAANMDYMIKKNIDLHDGVAEKSFTTRIFSVVGGILGWDSFYNTIAVNVLQDNGATTYSLWMKGLERAVEEGATVVLSPLGMISTSICNAMAAQPNIIFVVPAGASAAYLDAASLPGCDAANILLVASYSNHRQALSAFSNFGPLIRVATSGENIKVNDGEKEAFVSGVSFAAAITAAKLFQFAAHSQDRLASAAEVIAEFLANLTVERRDLFDQVAGGRVLPYGNR